MPAAFWQQFEIELGKAFSKSLTYKRQCTMLEKLHSQDEQHQNSLEESRETPAFLSVTGHLNTTRALCISAGTFVTPSSPC